MIQIKYVLGPSARVAVAKATGSLAMPETRVRDEHRDFLPQKGDVIAWDGIGPNTGFGVESRVFRIDQDGQIQVDLHIEAYGPFDQSAD